MTIHVKVLSARFYLGQLLAKIETTNTDYPGATEELDVRLAYAASVSDMQADINRMAKVFWLAYNHPEWDVPEA